MYTNFSPLSNAHKCSFTDRHYELEEMKHFDLSVSLVYFARRLLHGQHGYLKRRTKVGNCENFTRDRNIMQLHVWFIPAIVRLGDPASNAPRSCHVRVNLTCILFVTCELCVRGLGVLMATTFSFQGDINYSRLSRVNAKSLHCNIELKSLTENMSGP